MALRNIRKDGDPLLRKKSRPVTDLTPKRKQLLDDMLETMQEAEGIGLAAPQVGILRRMVVVDLGDHPYKMVNPEIVKESEDQTLDIEGCLSVPGYNGTVYRPREITVRYTDENNEDQELEAEGLLARCICHEVDHLEGILFKDKVDKTIDFNNMTQDMVDYLKEKGLVKEGDDQDHEGSDERPEGGVGEDNE